MFRKVLIANRGAVAARVLRSLRVLGIRSVAVYSEADAAAPYLEEADETFPIGPAHPRESYLNQDVLIDVLRKSGADSSAFQNCASMSEVGCECCWSSKYDSSAMAR